MIHVDLLSGRVMDVPAPTGGGSATTEQLLSEIAAAEDIPAFSLVTAGGEIADSSNMAHFNHVIGITLEAVLTGFIAFLVTEGEVTNPLWSWAPNIKLFLNGTNLSLTPPSSGFSQLVGVSRNSETVFIRPQKAIQL
jgi:hypothetical protein